MPNKMSSHQYDVDDIVILEWFVSTQKYKSKKYMAMKSQNKRSIDAERSIAIFWKRNLMLLLMVSLVIKSFPAVSTFYSLLFLGSSVALQMHLHLHAFLGKRTNPSEA